MSRGVIFLKKRPLILAVVCATAASLVLANLLPLAEKKSNASANSSISKTSTDDWDKGSTAGLATTSDEIKLASATNWSNNSYTYRKQTTVTAQTSNTITKGHTLNLAKVGSASFDAAGTGGYFNLGNSFNNIAFPITVESWINTKAAETAIFATDILNGGSYYGVWFLVDSNKKVVINYGDGGGATVNDRRTKVSNTAIELNKWTHVAAVIRGATDMSLYIDGVDAGGAYSGAGSNIVYSSSSSYETRIGAWNAGSPHTKGNIDELRVWSKGRTQGEIVADMNKEISAQTNLEGYYNFNQTTGNLIDNSGHNITGTLNGSAAYSPYSGVWGGLNTKELVDAGKMRSDCNDLRMFYGTTEIERELVPATGKTLAASEATQVLFKAQSQVAGGAADNDYYLYYGDSDAADPITTVYDKKFRTKNAYITPYEGSGSNYLQYNGDNISSAGDGTIEFWYKTSNAGSWHADSGPIFSGDDANANWYLWGNRWGYRFAANVGGNVILPSDPGNINDARGWNHTVLTWHNNDTTADVKIYENGTMTGSIDGGTKITNFPSYMKFIDNSSSYDGIEIGLVAAFNTVKDSTWVSSEYTRSAMMPIADGSRDASATFIHNFDGSGLDAIADNGGYASGTSTVTNSGVIMSGDYRQGDTNDERAGNTWVSGVYNWFDNFDTGNAKSQGISEFGNITNVSNELVLKNGQQAIINQTSTTMPTNYRLDVSAKGTQPEIMFNHQDKVGWWGNGMCMVNIAGVNNNSTDILFPRDAATGFLSGATSKYYLNIYNGFVPKYIQFDLATAGNYTGVVFEYWNGSAWTAFTPTSDGTANFSQSGIIDISNIIASFGASPASDGACSFPANHSVLRFSASAVTTQATINQISRVNDFAKLAYSTTANVISGDSHNATGNVAVARTTNAYSQIGIKRVGTSFESYLDSRRVIGAATNEAFNSNLLALSATTDATYDNLKIYKVLADEPGSSIGSESAKYVSGSYYTSPSDTADGSGILNLGWIGGWGSPNGFSANVVVPANTSIAFSIRSSAIGGVNDIDWTDWGVLGSATTTGEFTVSAGSMPNITLGSNKYLQLKAVFNTSDGTNTPVLSDYTIHYIADVDAPSNPSVNSLSVNGTGVDNTSWTSSTGNLSATFSGAADPGTESGVAGYYIYFGTSAAADPAVSGSYQAHVGALGDSQTYFSSISTSDDGKYYYLIFKTADASGNASSSSTIFQFGYDITIPSRPTFVSSDPAGYTTSNSFTFTWPAGSDPAGANGQSGIKWYEYKRATDADVDWSHTADASTRFVSGIEAYQEGANAFYVRSVDNAGNTSSSYQQVTYYWSGAAPAKPTSLSVTPETSDQNSFTISWDKPVTAPEDSPVVGYYYSINATPTISNVTYVENQSDHVLIGPAPYATAQGTNTVYVVAVNSAGNLSFEPAYVASDTFTCVTAAPATPTSVSLYDSSDRVLDRWMLTAQWVTGVGGGTVDHYSIERSTNGVDFSSAATTKSTAFIDASGLSNTVEYYYRIKAVDNAGKESAPSSVVHKTPTGKYTEPPAVLSGPTSSSIKSTSATITWTTDRSSTSIVRYGMQNDGTFAASTGNMEATTNHSVSVLGLNPSTTYYYQVQSLDEDRDYTPESAYSQTYSFVTGLAPAISETKVDNITLNSADISFITTTVATSTINFGTTNTYGTKVDDISGIQATGHKVKLTNLTPGTTYHFRIVGTDIENNILTSDDYQFDTLPLPKVENFSIEEIKGRPRPAFKAMWTTNVPTSTVLRYNPGSGEWEEEVSSKLDTGHAVEVSDLLDNSTYQIVAGGRDSLGNLAESPAKSFATPEDSRPPEISEIIIESSMLGGDEGKSQIAVGWKTDEPTTSKVEFGQGTNGGYTDSTPEDSELTTDHQVVISNLSPSATYHLKIVVKDKANNPAESASQIFVTNEGREGVWNLILKTLSDIFGFIRITK